MMQLFTPLAISLTLFALGVYGVLTRRDLMRLFLSVAIMLSAISLLLVVSASSVQQARITQSLAIIVWIVEAGETIVAAALFLSLLRSGKEDIATLRELKW